MTRPEGAARAYAANIGLRPHLEVVTTIRAGSPRFAADGALGARRQGHRPYMGKVEVARGAQQSDAAIGEAMRRPGATAIAARTRKSRRRCKMRARATAASSTRGNCSRQRAVSTRPATPPSVKVHRGLWDSVENEEDRNTIADAATERCGGSCEPRPAHHPPRVRTRPVPRSRLALSDSAATAQKPRAVIDATTRLRAGIDRSRGVYQRRGHDGR